MRRIYPSTLDTYPFPNPYPTRQHSNNLNEWTYYYRVTTSAYNTIVYTRIYPMIYDLSRQYRCHDHTGCTHIAAPYFLQDCSALFSSIIYILAIYLRYLTVRYRRYRGIMLRYKSRGRCISQGIVCDLRAEITFRGTVAAAIKRHLFGQSRARPASLQTPLCRTPKRRY